MGSGGEGATEKIESVWISSGKNVTNGVENVNLYKPGSKVVHAVPCTAKVSSLVLEMDRDGKMESLGLTR